MKHAVLHPPVLLPAVKNQQSQIDKTEKQTDQSNFIIALGMRVGDPGYRYVLHEISKLGSLAHFNEGLLFLTTTLSIDEAFNHINKSIIDPRIPSNVGLVILDTRLGHAKWYLNREISEVLVAHWHHRTNLFICHNNTSNQKLLYDINALGHAVPVSEHIWYVSTTYAPREAYQILSQSRDEKERLTLFDASGRVYSWQREAQLTRVQLTHSISQLPTRATIHQPRSWQASMLAEFL